MNHLSLRIELAGVQALNNNKQTNLSGGNRVEAPITDHLRDSLLDMEKYKAAQNFRM